MKGVSLSFIAVKIYFKIIYFQDKLTHIIYCFNLETEYNLKLSNSCWDEYQSNQNQDV